MIEYELTCSVSPYYLDYLDYLDYLYYLDSPYSL